MNNDQFIHLGVVVQNNDPEMRGRIKVYVPYVAPTVDGLNENTDKFFNFLGKNNETSSEITDTLIKNTLQTLKDTLPWAEYAGPICGGNASGRYNATLKTGTTSDSNAWSGDILKDGFRPAQNLIDYNSNKDAFSQTGLHKNRFVNEYTYQYTPSNYSGLARGLFSIPNVGAHVYVFFLQGDRNFPIYFASAYSQHDIKRIYTLTQDVDDNTNIDYPATYENIDTGTPTAAAKTFRSKTVLNSNKHTIELVDTDLREILKFTHYSGSFKEFNNYSNIELATNNDQKLVKGDQFLTVNRNQSLYIKTHRELIVGGDNYINIGETDHTKVQAILDIHRQIHEYKLLFNVQRAKYKEQAPNNLSKYQTRNPPLNYARCPVCNGKLYDPYDPLYVSDKGLYSEVYDFWKQAPTYQTEICINESVPNSDPSQPEGTFLSGPCHSILNEAYADEPETNLDCRPVPHPFEGRLGYYRGSRCACCNNELIANPKPGFSPSTENGRWNIEPKKLKNGEMDTVILNGSKKLFDLEKVMGAGGDEIKTVSMNKIETIGLVMNDLLSFRVDPIGKLKIDGCWVAPQGTYNNFRPSPHVEYVDVADIPGGDYVLTCMNKYKLLVGSRGVNIQTSGPMDIYGTIVNLNAEQLNIGSKNEVVIDGGERLTLRARKITALPVEHNAFVVEGLLHVTRNVIIEGGSMLEGEVALLHVTAPIQWYETESALWEATPDLNPLCQISAIITPSAPLLVPGVPIPVKIQLPKHRHWYKNLPMTLLQHPEAVREVMIEKGINSRNKIIASAPAANPSNTCDQNLFNEVRDAFFNTAYAEAQKQYEHQSGRTDPIDREAVNGPNRQLCIETETNGTKLTEIRATYNWRYREIGGSVTVTGTVDEEGNIISGPSATG